MRILNNLKITVIMFIVGSAIYLIARILNFDVFEFSAGILNSLENFEVDEIFVVVILIIIGLAIDMFVLKNRRAQEIIVQQQRLRVLRATMRSVQDIVNNFLQSMQLFTMEAEKKQALNSKSLETINSLIFETTNKINRLSALESTPEREIAGMTFIDLNGNLSNNNES